MSIDKSHLILYKNPKLYNGSRYVYYQDNRDYDNWLSLSSYQTYSKDVVFKSLEENITINAFIDNVDEYTYGSITLNKTKYYFFVDKVSTDAYNQTTISYTIDWWATKWFAVTCTKANLKRSSVKPEYMAQPFSYNPYFHHYQDWLYMRIGLHHLYSIPLTSQMRVPAVKRVVPYIQA